MMSAVAMQFRCLTEEEKLYDDKAPSLPYEVKGRFLAHIFDVVLFISASVCERANSSG